MTSKPTFTWPGRRSDDPAHDRVAELLGLDIQRSSAWAHQLAEQIELVRTSELASWQRTGNAYSLVLTADGAEIRDMVDESREPQRVPLAELADAVAAWQNWIESDTATS